MPPPVGSSGAPVSPVANGYGRQQRFRPSSPLHTPGGYGPHPGGYGAPMGDIPQAAPAAPRRAVTYTPRDTNHLLHLVLTIFTCGLWGFVWILMVVLNAMSKKKSVTHYR